MSKRMQDCPPPRVWDELATGLLTGEPAQPYLDHASWCNACALRLRESLDVFAPDEATTGGRVRLPRRWHWPIAAALLVAGLLGVMLWWRRPADPLFALAQAYGRQRTAAFRIAGAPFSPLRATRSGTAALADRPADWLNTAAQIRTALDANPRDPRWLHAQGRLALMDQRPDEAITALRMARDLGALGEDVTIDLAAAYYQRALSRGDAGAPDLTMGQELLSSVLKRSPGHTAALFNRALIAAELQELAPAIADLERLLTIEKEGGWRQEAQDRLAKLRERLRAFLAPDGGAASRWAEVALDSYLRDPLRPAPDLARRFQEAHGDPWVSELASLPRTTSREDAFRRLAQLAEIRLTAQRGRYRTERADAEPLERATLDPPLAAWRDFEMAYRSTHSGGAFLCRVADRIPRRYRWLWVQARREAGTCGFAKDNLDEMRRLTAESRDAAREAGLPVSEVRSEALLASQDYLQGHYRHALSRQRVVLKRILDQQLPPARAHEPVHSMMLSARALGRHHAAHHAALMAIEVAQAAGLHSAEFSDRINAAELALRTGNPAAAREQYQRAIRIYDDSRGEAAPESGRAWAEVIMAEASADLQRLRPYEAFLESTPDLSARLPYLRVRAQADAPREAERRLLQAWRLLRSAEAGTRLPGLWRDEAALAANQLIGLLLSEARAGDAFRLVQELLAAKDPRPSGHRAALGAYTLFSLRAVGNRVLVWRRDPRGMVTVRQADMDASAMERLVRRLRRFAASPAAPAAEVRAAAEALTGGLFGTWLTELPPGNVIVMQAEGILEAIPFPLLRGKTQELGREQRIAFTSGPAGEPNDVHRALVPAPRRTLMVDATRDAGLAALGLAPLPPPDEELGALRRYAPGLTVLRGAAPAAVRAALPSVGLLHFAGHALAGPAGTGLVLGGEVWRDAAAGVPPRVVLSACSTSRVEQDEEDTLGPNSLAQVFLLSGAAEVVAADWDWDHQAAAALMAAFYEELARREDIGSALLAGVRHVAAQAEFAHPYYWAGVRWLVRL